jgi:hypothetical protein
MCVVLQHKANFAPGYACRAGVYYRQKDYDETLAAAQEAVQADDDYALGHFYVGVATANWAMLRLLGNHCAAHRR